MSCLSSLRTEITGQGTKLQNVALPVYEHMLARPQHANPDCQTLHVDLAAASL